MLIHLNLGSNVEPRRSNLEQALNLLEETPQITLMGCSRIYETPAIGMIDADAGAFYNMCVSVRTSFMALNLLERTQQIELAVGRPATIKGKTTTGKSLSRVIDIDIVLAEDLRLTDDNLTIPHPGLFTRSFFLWPLLEICPNACCPRSRVPLKTFLTGAVSPPILRTLPAGKNA